MFVSIQSEEETQSSGDENNRNILKELKKKKEDKKKQTSEVKSRKNFTLKSQPLPVELACSDRVCPAGGSRDTQAF